MTGAALPDTRDAAAEFAALTGDGAIKRQIRTGLVIVGVLAAFLIAGSTFARLDSAVMAYGVVQAEGQDKVVEHPDGGVVSAILVREGDLVKQGQVLMRLDPTQANASLAIEQTAVDTLAAQLARLEAEAVGAPTIAFPKSLTDRASDPAVAAIMAGQTQLLGARRHALRGQAGAISEEIGQAHSMADGYRGQIAAVDQQAQTISEELAGMKKLYAKGFATKSQVDQLERAASALEGQKREYQANLDRLGHSVGQYQEQASQLGRDRLSSVAEQLDDARAKLAEATQRLAAIQAVVDHTTIRAPVTGYVFGLAANGAGAVVAKGEKLLEILPKDASPIVETRVRPGDGGRLQKGMKVQVRVTASQWRGLPALHGTVQSRSADLIADPKTGQPFYSLVVAIDRDEVDRPGGPSLDVGTPVEVVVPTGSRTALAYMFQPMMESLGHGLKEQ
ncbi:HlyD family type I secretion periplasmic adaptor subunit [Phenylobacterium montanum]|uniref:Membrane fusion protein (MFP) family protein n=1 Tax=Phenylobacterium montanum TaxID=2823693 RepID=A0A975FYL0_9CAUL|nr:HlyD family type I secretion periplasmic adaptor subunit [Caulobacter sp. S6]QUD87222.1 HlyD family type I secretion periplasmic adaptor subunit [Caulobacter sp. S6]